MPVHNFRLIHLIINVVYISRVLGSDRLLQDSFLYSLMLATPSFGVVLKAFFGVFGEVRIVAMGVV